MEAIKQKVKYNKAGYEKLMQHHFKDHQPTIADLQLLLKAAAYTQQDGKYKDFSLLLDHHHLYFNKSHD